MKIEGPITIEKLKKYSRIINEKSEEIAQKCYNVQQSKVLIEGNTEKCEMELHDAKFSAIEFISGLEKEISTMRHRDEESETMYILENMLEAFRYILSAMFFMGTKKDKE